MKVRGRRECVECGTRWSYYETASVYCPACGSIRSRGIDDERTLHTASPEELDLTEIRVALEERSLSEATEEAKERCREYVRTQGFVRGGELLDLSETYVAARELAHVADLVGRTMDLREDEEWYLLELLRDADRGKRPDPADVPTSFLAARGLAVAESVEDYRSEVRDWLDEQGESELDEQGESGLDEQGESGLDETVTEDLVTVGEHATRLEALQGEVPSATAERLLTATRELATAIREDDQDALRTARDRLDRLAELPED